MSKVWNDDAERVLVAPHMYARLHPQIFPPTSPLVFKLPVARGRFVAPVPDKEPPMPAIPKVKK